MVKIPVQMWLLLDTNRESYMGSPSAPLVVKSQIQGHLDFEGLYLVKVAGVLGDYATIKK